MPVPWGKIFCGRFLLFENDIVFSAETRWKVNKIASKMLQYFDTHKSLGPKTWYSRINEIPWPFRRQKCKIWLSRVGRFRNFTDWEFGKRNKRWVELKECHFNSLGPSANSKSEVTKLPSTDGWQFAQIGFFPMDQLVTSFCHPSNSQGGWSFWPPNDAFSVQVSTGALPYPMPGLRNLSSSRQLTV